MLLPRACSKSGSPEVDHKLLEEGHPHTFSFTKKTARFTKGRSRPYEGPPPALLYYKTPPCLFSPLPKLAMGGQLLTRTILCSNCKGVCCRGGQLSTPLEVAGVFITPDRLTLAPEQGKNVLASEASWDQPHPKDPSVLSLENWGNLT